MLKNKLRIVIDASKHDSHDSCDKTRFKGYFNVHIDDVITKFDDEDNSDAGNYAMEDIRPFIWKTLYERAGGVYTEEIEETIIENYIDDNQLRNMPSWPVDRTIESIELLLPPVTDKTFEQWINELVKVNNMPDEKWSWQVI